MNQSHTRPMAKEKDERESPTGILLLPGDDDGCAGSLRVFLQCHVQSEQVLGILQQCCSPALCTFFLFPASVASRDRWLYSCVMRKVWSIWSSVFLLACPIYPPSPLITFLLWCVYVCVCAHMCMCVCICVCVYMCMCEYVYVCVHM